jgi:hypothetical protein
VEGLVRDLNEDQPLPRADYVVMQASLYHFLPNPVPMVDRMLESAARQVIIAEPIVNLSDSRIPLLSAFSRRFTDAGSGAENHRFNEQSLDAFFHPYQSRIIKSFKIPGGREKVYVLNGAGV